MSGTVMPGAGGYIDLWGDAGAPDRTILCGWVGHPWKAALTSGILRVECKAASGQVLASATGCVFVRADIAAIGFGVILVCDAPDTALAGLEFVDVIGISPPCRLRLGPGIQRLDAQAVRDMVRPLILRATPLDHRSIALACIDLAEDGYRGTTDAALSIDGVLDAAGTLILGRVTAATTTVQTAAMTVGASSHPIDPGRILCGPPEAMGDKFRFRLILRAEGAAHIAGQRWLDVTLDDGSVARAALPPPLPGHRETMLKLLEAVDPDTDIDRQFDAIIGPAIAALQQRQAALPLRVTQAAFGTPPVKPHASLVIPLHRRIDFLEVQLGLFSAQPCMDNTDIIYVVDDLVRQAEARVLAASAFARFGVPFRLLQPSRNLGFARASNLGLAAARAPLVCFMNSDVFPGTPDWLTRLAAHLARDATLGLVAPMLLFPDGSVQHRGMALHPLPRFGGWHFPRHTGKGLRPDGAGLINVAAVTGACILMRRSLAEALHGFDEGYVIGDFEDSDLCARAAGCTGGTGCTGGAGCTASPGGAGFTAAVDLDVRMLHLERQSQGADAPWRMGATLYNAWRHERRWFPPPAPAPAPARRRKA